MLLHMLPLDDQKACLKGTLSFHSIFLPRVSGFPVLGYLSVWLFKPVWCKGLKVGATFLLPINTRISLLNIQGNCVQ